jgi:hypothetical protein
MICLHTKFHLLISNTSLGIAVRLKYEYRFHAVAMLLFYILQNANTTEVGYVSKVYYHISFESCKVSGATVSSTSQVRMSAMLVFLVEG